MSYVQGEDCGQAALLPAAIEDYVAADAPVRAIDAFVLSTRQRCSDRGDMPSLCVVLSRSGPFSLHA